MRRPDDMPRRERRRRVGTNRGRIVLIVVAIALFVLITSLRAIASFYTDYLWFRSVGQTGVWRGVLGTKLVLAGIFIAVFFALLWVSLFIADRLAPKFRPTGPEEELIERYHELVGGHAGLVRIGVAGLFAVIAGAPASSQWNEWLLFRNRVSFGTTDPQFHKDLGFYIFQLPFLTFVVGWLFAAFVIVFIVTAVAHYVNGGIRVQTPFQRVTPQVKAHLSVLLALLALVKLGGYYLQQFELTTSTRGTVDGATYTDVKVQLPAIQLLMLISVAAAALFIFNIFRRGWVLPVLGVGLWAFVAIIAGSILPAIIQKFRVEPSESSKERPYIERNIAATRDAMNVSTVELKGFQSNGTLSTTDLLHNDVTVSNIRVWDPASQILRQTYQALQTLQAFYQIGDVDVDRYQIGGRTTQVMVSARELNTGGVPQTSWEARHLAFTHGYGVVASPANAKDTDGRPNLIVRDVPITDTAGLGIKEPSIYFGEGLGNYVITNTKRQEIDFQGNDGKTVFRSYAGNDGIDMGSILNRAAFALRFGDFNPLVSGNLTSSSKILINRDVRTRLEQIAPFLSYDGDPYPVVVDGRIKWIVDAFTTSDRYPYAQRAQTEGVVSSSGLQGGFNYVRNSVKAVVDAYDGSITLYVVDNNDRIVRAYEKAFPKLFSTSPAPDAIQAHFRYPEDLFKVQTNMWGRYHIDDPDTFYNRSDAWVVARDPGIQRAQVQTTSSTQPDANDNQPPAPQNRIDPYYLLMKLPNETDESFLILRPFVPFSADDSQASSRQQLTAFMVAKSDPGSYGKLETFVMPTDRRPDGPGLVAGTMQADTAVSQAQTLLGQQGSEVRLGNLVLIPIEQSLLYVRPVYVVASQNQLPLLRKIIVEFEGRVSIADTLQDALRGLDRFRDLPATTLDENQQTSGGEQPPPPAGGTQTPDQTIGQLLSDANRLFDEANQALANQDLATFQSKYKEAQAKVKQASDLFASSAGGSSGSTTTSTTAPATTTTTTTTTTVGSA